MSRTILALPLFAAALAGCGSSGGGATSASTSAPPMTRTQAAGPGSTVKLKADEEGKLYFNRKTASAKAGKVTLVMEDPGSSGVPHGIAIEGNGVDRAGEVVKPGGKSTVTVDLKPGRYTYYCPVPGHEAGGMKGTLTVT